MTTKSHKLLVVLTCLPPNGHRVASNSSCLNYLCNRGLASAATAARSSIDSKFTSRSQSTTRPSPLAPSPPPPPFLKVKEPSQSGIRIPRRKSPKAAACDNTERSLSTRFVPEKLERKSSSSRRRESTLGINATKIQAILEADLSDMNLETLEVEHRKYVEEVKKKAGFEINKPSGLKKCGIIDIKPTSELKFKSPKCISDAKQMSLNLKQMIINDPSSLDISKINEIVFMHLLYMRILLNHAKSSNNPINDKIYQEALLNKFLTHFYYAENALNYAFVMNKSKYQSEYIDDMILLEDLSLLVYTQIFSHHNLNKININACKNLETSQDYSDLTLFDSIMQNRKACSKTAQLKIPGICKELVALKNKFIGRIVMHKNLVPQIDLKAYKFDIDCCPSWVINHFTDAFKFELRAKKSIKETLGNREEFINHHFGNFDITRYLDISENSISKYVRFQNSNQHNSVGSPLMSLTGQTNVNNQPVIKEIIAQRQKLAHKCGFQDYHQFLLERSPRHIFNFKFSKEQSLDQLQTWLFRVSKINKSIIKDFVCQTQYIINYQKQHDLRYLINRIAFKSAKSLCNEQTFFNVKSVISGFQKILSEFFSLEVKTHYKSTNPNSVKHLEIFDRNSSNHLSTIILDLDFSPNKFLYQHRYEVNHICSRRSSDTNSILYILANQCTKGTNKYGDTIHYPLTFFQMLDFLYALGKCIEYSINSKRIFTTSSIPIGSENLIASFLIHLLTSPDNIKHFICTKDYTKKHEVHEQPLSISKIFSWATSVHKVTDFAEKSNKALFDLNSHSSSEMSSIFKSEQYGSLNSTLLFKNWNSCYPLLMDRKNRFFYSFSHCYVNYYATTYYANIVAEIASFAPTKLLTQKLPDTNLLSKFSELLDPSQPGLDDELIKMTNYNSLNSYFKYYGSKIRSIPL